MVHKAPSMMVGKALRAAQFMVASGMYVETVHVTVDQEKRQEAHPGATM